MINADGAVLDRWLGYPGAEAWAAIIDKNVANPETIDSKKERFAAAPDADLARSLGSYSAAVQDNKGAVDYYRQAQKLAPETAAELDMDILDAISSGVRSEDFTVDEVFAAADVIIENTERSAMDLIMVVFNVRGAANQSGHPERIAPYLELAMARSADSEDEDVARYRKYLVIPHALHVEKDPDKALALKRADMPEGWQEDPGQLNSFAWWCYESRLNLEEALELAIKGSELAEDGDKANILDTAADIAFAQGHTETAVKLITQAIELNPERQYFKDQLEKFSGETAD